MIPDLSQIAQCSLRLEENNIFTLFYVSITENAGDYCAGRKTLGAGRMLFLKGVALPSASESPLALPLPLALALAALLFAGRALGEVADGVAAGERHLARAELVEGCLGDQELDFHSTADLRIL